MGLSIAQELKQTFHLAALRKESNDLLTGRQWENRRTLIRRCKAARQKENALFDKRYDVRIATQQKKLLGKAGSKTKQFKPSWAQDDVFDKSASLAQADTNVRSAHENRLAHIDQYEQRGLENLMQSARAENKVQGKPTQEFNHKTDRRFADRRAGSSRNQTR